MKKVIFAGAGPGAADLITLRGKLALETADIVIYAGSLVNPELLGYAGAEAEKINSAGLNLNQVIEIIKSGAASGKQVVRLHTGDPALYGAIAEQMDMLDNLGIDYEVIPGVSSVFAAAAELKCELTVPGLSQSAILTRRAGRTPVPPGEEIERLAANGATVAVFLSVSDLEGLVADFYRAGRSPETPAAVVYRASWPNQKIVRGTLGDIARRTAEAGIKRQAIVMVGDILKRGGERSLLYDDTFSHGYREAESGLQHHERTALYALTSGGALKALEIAGGMPEAEVFLPENCSGKQPMENVNYFNPGELDWVIADAWHRYDAHIFVMACGIVIRKISRLLINKLSDPAVVCCDERGDFAVALLSGHLGGANLLARRVAGITGGRAVISTATDVNNLTAFDQAAGLENYRIVNPGLIKEFNRRLLAGERIDMLVPESFFRKYYAGLPNLTLIADPSHCQAPAVVSLNCPIETAEFNLRFSDSGGINVGIGCRRGTDCETLETALLDSLAKLGAKLEDINCIATFEAKRDEAGLLELVKKHGLRIKFFDRETLNRIETPNHTPRAQLEFGVDSVCEAAALAMGGRLILEKQKYPSVTVAVAKEEDV